LRGPPGQYLSNPGLEDLTFPVGRGSPLEIESEVALGVEFFHQRLKSYGGSRGDGVKRPNCGTVLEQFCSPEERANRVVDMDQVDRLVAWREFYGFSRRCRYQTSPKLGRVSFSPNVS
jgi:hypothetical protein